MGTTCSAQYTIEEVMQHNKVDNFWIIIDDNVYDITNFIKNHPFGPTPVINMTDKCTNRNVTNEFYKGHGKYHLNKIKCHIIGKIKK